MAVNASLPMAPERGLRRGSLEEHGAGAGPNNMASISSRITAQQQHSPPPSALPAAPATSVRHTFIVTPALSTVSASAAAAASASASAAASASNSNATTISRRQPAAGRTPDSLPVADAPRHQRASSELSNALSVDTQCSSTSASCSVSPVEASQHSATVSGSASYKYSTHHYRVRNSASGSSPGTSPLSSATTSLERSAGGKFTFTKFFRDAFRGKSKAADKSLLAAADSANANANATLELPPDAHRERRNTGPSSRLADPKKRKHPLKFWSSNSSSAGSRSSGVASDSVSPVADSKPSPDAPHSHSHLGAPSASKGAPLDFHFLAQCILFFLPNVIYSYLSSCLKCSQIQIEIANAIG